MCQGSAPGAPMLIVCSYAIVTVSLCGTDDLDEGAFVCAVRTQHKLASPEVVVHLLPYTCQGPGVSLPFPLPLSLSPSLSLSAFFFSASLSHRFEEVRGLGAVVEHHSGKLTALTKVPIPGYPLVHR